MVVRCAGQPLQRNLQTFPCSISRHTPGVTMGDNLSVPSEASACQRTCSAGWSAQEGYLFQVHISNHAFDILTGIDFLYDPNIILKL
jgi:hypothetical protein